MSIFPLPMDVLYSALDDRSHIRKGKDLIKLCAYCHHCCCYYLTALSSVLSLQQAGRREGSPTVIKYSCGWVTTMFPMVLTHISKQSGIVGKIEVGE